MAREYNLHTIGNMKRLIFFVILSFLALFLTNGFASAQVYQNSWIYSSGTLKPAVSTWSLTISQLGSSGTPCVSVTNTAGLLGTTTCGSGGSGGSGIATSSLAATWPITLTTNSSNATYGFNGLSTSTAAVSGNIPYFSGVNTFANVATSTLAVNSSLSVASGTFGNQIGGSNVTFGLNLGNANSWTGLQQFTNASSSLFSCYGPCYFGGTATSSFNTTGQLTLTGITSSLLTTNSSGLVAAYAGTSCTNQFVRSLNGAGAATCATASLASDVTGTLPIANGGTGTTTWQTGSIPYFNGTTLTENNTNLLWTNSGTLLTATNASTTNVTILTSLKIPTASNPAPTIAGYTAQSTNSPYQLQIGNGNSGTVVLDQNRFITFTYATSSPVGTTTLPVGVFPEAMTLNTIQCWQQGAGTTTEVRFYYGPVPTSQYLNASSTINTNTWTSSNTPGAGATSTVDFGNWGANNQSYALTCTIKGTITGL